MVLKKIDKTNVTGYNFKSVYLCHIKRVLISCSENS